MICLRENASASITGVILVARSEAFAGRKSTKKLVPEIKISFRDHNTFANYDKLKAGGET
jgi:hypothetical protein